MDENAHHGPSDNAARSYLMLAVNMVISLAIMYFAMYTMIDGWQDFRNNLNMFYMALTMWAPMGILMLATMGGMYRIRGVNLALYILFAAVALGSLWATRSQALINDRYFIASMIPHHSGAILMCREARLQDPELVQLCNDITVGQRREIEQMNAIAARLR